MTEDSEKRDAPPKQQRDAPPKQQRPPRKQPEKPAAPKPVKPAPKRKQPEPVLPDSAEAVNRQGDGGVHGGSSAWVRHGSGLAPVGGHVFGG